MTLSDHASDHPSYRQPSKSGRLSRLKMTDADNTGTVHPDRLGTGLILHGIRDIVRAETQPVAKAFSYFDIAEPHMLPDANENKFLSGGYDIKPFSYDALSGADHHDESDAFHMDTYYDLTDADMHALSDAHHLIASLLDTLSVSKTGAMMIAEAARAGYIIDISESDVKDYSYDMSDKCVTLITGGMNADAVMRSGYFFHHVLLSLVHALRDCAHERQAGTLRRFYDVNAVFLLERLRIADVDVVAVMIAHELMQAGKGGLWSHMMTTDCHDVAQAYQSSPSADGLLRATQDAFYQWFANHDRVSAADGDILDYMDGIMTDSPSHYALSGLKTMNAHVIERLSTLPDKTRYLDGQGRNILTNPMFTHIRDADHRQYYDYIAGRAKVTFAGGVAFRDQILAEKLFPAS